MTTRGIRPKWVLDWFENQPFDQANMHGFHLAQPGSRVIGLRLYAQYSSNLMSFQVTNREVNDCLAPSTQWACGKAWLPTATAYDTRATYEVVPALRYAYLYEMEARKTEGSECLVLLTHALPESLRILGAVANVAPIIGFAFSRIQIKPHPVLDAKRCKRTARKHYANLSDDKFAHWVETPMADLLGSARIVISAGTSSAVEAVSLGIPVIIIGASVGIEMCALEFVDQRMWRIAYNEGELIRAIEEWTPFHPLLREIRVSIGEATKLQCFEPKTEASMERFNLG